LRLVLAGAHRHHETADALCLRHIGRLAQLAISAQHFLVGQLQEALLAYLLHGLDAVVTGHADGAEIAGRQHGGEQSPFLAGHLLGFQEKDKGHLLPVNPADAADAHGAQQVLEEGVDQVGITVNHRFPGEPQAADPGPQAGEVVKVFQGCCQGAGKGGMGFPRHLLDLVDPLDGAVRQVVLVLQGRGETAAFRGDEAAGESPFLLQFMNQLADFDADFRPRMDQPGAVPIGLLFQQVVGGQGGNGEEKGQQQPQGLTFDGVQGRRRGVRRGALLLDGSIHAVFVEIEGPKPEDERKILMCR